MKRPRTALAILLGALLLPLCAASADVRAWRADLSSAEVRVERLRRGDVATLEARLYLGGAPYAPTNATCHYRSSLASTNWLPAACAVSSNTVSTVVSPLLEIAGDVVPFLFRIDGETYRAAAMVYLSDSPGDAPSVGPPVLDFGAYAITNAPWALPSDIPAPPVTSVNGQTGAVALAASDVGAATVADATLTARTGFSDWVFAEGLLEAAQECFGPNIPALATDSHLELFADAGGAETVWLMQDDGPARVDFASASLRPGGLVADLVGGMPWVFGIVQPGGAIATRAALTGYQLGSQSDMPLAAATHTHTADEVSGLPDAPDYSATNAALVATIQTVAPPPGDYETVSNLATSAVQPSELPGLVPEYIVSPETARGTAYTGVSRDTALRDGKMILYYMQTQATAAWTLNLTLADGTATGAKPVRFWGTTTVSTHYAAGSILPLVYRSGAWYISDRDTNSDTFDRVRVNTAIRAAAAISRNRMCVGSADGYRGIAAGVTFDSTYPPLYLNRTSTLSAGATETQFYASFPGINAAYTVSAWPGKQRAALYLVGSLADDGRTFTIGDPALSYDPTPPCIPLGIFHATTTNSFYFCPGPLITGATGGGADTGAVTNLVSDILAAEVDALPVESTLEVHRLVLADLWDRVDRLAGSSDADAIDDLRLAISGLDARLTALEESAASAAASISALSAMSSLRFQSADLQSGDTAPATSVQDPSDAR